MIHWPHKIRWWQSKWSDSESYWIVDKVSQIHLVWSLRTYHTPGFQLIKLNARYFLVDTALGRRPGRNKLSKKRSKTSVSTTRAATIQQRQTIRSEKRTNHIKQSDRKSTRLNSSHPSRSRMPSSAWKKKIFQDWSIVLVSFLHEFSINPS